MVKIKEKDIKEVMKIYEINNQVGKSKFSSNCSRIFGECH